MPRLRADVRTRVVAPATVILSDGDDVPFVLESPALAAMVPLLDGRTPIERIAVAIADRASLTDIVLAITSLERAGLIVEGPGLDDGAAAAYWEASGVDAADAVQRLADAGVATLAVGGVELDSLHGALAELGVAVREDAALTCVLADDYLQPELDEVSRRLAGTPWLVARPLGRELWLGPFFRSPESGCWSCLVERLRAHPRATEGPRPTLPTTEAAAAALVATQIAMILASGRSQALEGALVTINTATLELQRHALLPAAGCTVCGDPSPSSSPRSRTAGETLARLLPELSPVLGFVGGLTRAPSPLGDVVHVWFAGRGGSAAGGKGRTETEAKASAVCEAIERHCGRFRESVPRVRGTFAERGDAAVPPDVLLLYSERQYASRENGVPIPFDAGRPIDWTRVWSLTADRPRELPSAFCWLGYPDADFCRADSNGCAAGATVEDAVLHGVLELVERDGVALWWYTRGRVRGVDLDSFSDRYADALREGLETVGRELWALDLTTDLGIPTFAALSRRVGEPSEQILLGFGAHLDPCVALTRALTEHNQALAVVETFPGTLRPEHREWLARATLASEPWLRPRDGSSARRLSDFPALASHDDVGADVRTCVDRLAAAGSEVLVLDQSRPDVDLSVVRVAAPGLRHFWRRLAPGRLYDVPPALGWVEAAPAEEDLNPWSVFL